MANETDNTTLVFGVRTDQAVKNIQALAVQLNQLKKELPALAAAVNTSARAVDTGTRDTAQRTRRATQDMAEGAKKVTVSYRQMVDGVSVSMRQAVDASDKAYTSLTQKVEQFAKNPAHAYALKQQQEAEKQALNMAANMQRLANKRQQLDAQELKRQVEYSKAVETNMQALAGRRQKLDADELSRLDQYSRGVERNMQTLAAKRQQLDTAELARQQKYSQDIDRNMQTLAAKRQQLDAAELARQQKYSQSVERNMQTLAAKRQQLDAAELARQQKYSQDIERNMQTLAARRRVLDERNVSQQLENARAVERNMQTLATKRQQLDELALERQARYNRQVAENMGGAFARETARREAEQRKIEESKRRHNERMLRLDSRYLEMSEAARRSHMEKMARYQLGTGAGAEAMLGRYGGRAFNDPAYQGVLQAVAAGQNSVTTATNQARLATEAQRRVMHESALSMRDAHSAARGLAGSMNMLWLTWGQVAAISAGAAVGGMARGTYQVGKDLEYRLAFIEAMGNDPISVNQMMPAVMGTMKTPLEAAEGLQALTQAGLSSNQALQTLASTLSLSTFGELGMVEAAHAMTGALAAFNLEADQAGRVGDVYAKAAAMSNTTVQGIVESMRQASTAAADYNISIEEISAGLSIMAERNITGSMAGTAYRNMLKELYTPIARGAKALESLGISAYDSENKMRPLSDVLVDVQRKLVTLDDASRSRALEAIFGERGARAIRPILADLAAYTERIKEMDQAHGFLAEGSARLIDTVEGAQNRMQSTLQQSFAKSFADTEPMIRSTLASMEKLFASDNFVRSVTTIAGAFARVTTILTDHAGIVASVGAAYVTLRLTQALMATTSRGLEGATRMLSSAKSMLTTQTLASAAAQQAETVASNNLTRANERNNAAKLTGAARAMGLVAGLSRIVGGATVAGAAIITLTSLVTSLADAFDWAEKKQDTLADTIGKRWRAIIEQRQSQKEIQAFERSNTPLGLEEGRAALEARLAELNSEIVKHEDTIDSLGRAVHIGMEARASGISMNKLRTIEEELAKENGYSSFDQMLQAHRNSRKHLNDLKAEQEATIIEITETYKDVKEAIESGDTQAAISQLVSGSLSQLDGLENMAQFLEPDSNVLGLVEAIDFEELRKKLRGAKTVEDAKAFSDEVTAIWREVNKAQSSWELPGGGEGSLVFRSNVQNLMQAYRNQDQLLTSRRDAELRAIQELAKVGAYTSDEAASLRSKVWDTYIEKTMANARDTEAKIRAIDKGSPELHELAVERLQETAQQARRQGELNQELEEYNLKIQDRVSAMKLAISTAGDMEKAELSLIEKIKESHRQYSEAYMSQEQLLQSQGAAMAEEAYNKLIVDRQAALAKLVERYGQNEAAKLEEYKATEATIGKLREELEVRKALTAEALIQQFNQNNTVTAGFTRGMATYQREITNIGDLAADAIQNSFGALEKGITDVFAKGKFDAKEFGNVVIGEFARIMARQSMLNLFGQGGSGGGGGGFLGQAVSAGIGWLTGRGATPTGMLPVQAVNTGSNLGSFAVAHTGGIVGHLSTVRAASPGLFSGAPRLHTGGIAGGEVPIIARRGEGVFTPEQMKALAPAGSSPTVIIHQTVNVDSRADQASILQGMQFAKEAAVRDIAEQFSRDGMMRRLAN
jgi:TP901 family phage tail tape measure protein